jgi:hypothetical protein
MEKAPQLSGIVLESCGAFIFSKKSLVHHFQKFGNLLVIA